MQLIVPVTRDQRYSSGKRSISADTALRLSRYFGTTPKFWINLQSNYDLELAQDAQRRRDYRPHHATPRGVTSTAAGRDFPMDPLHFRHGSSARVTSRPITSNSLPPPLLLPASPRASGPLRHRPQPNALPASLESPCSPVTPRTVATSSGEHTMPSYATAIALRLRSATNSRNAARVTRIHQQIPIVHAGQHAHAQQFQILEPGSSIQAACITESLA